MNHIRMDIKRVIAVSVMEIIVFTALFAMPLWVDGKGAPVQNIAYAAPNESMVIHAIYLGRPSVTVEGTEEYRGGDAVLLESKGEFLLMDTGDELSQDNVLDYLKDVVTIKKPLSIYISHPHLDHYGAYQSIFKDFTIKDVYLPDPWFSGSFLGDKMKDAIKSEGATLHYLHYNPTTNTAIKSPKPINSFKIGDASIKIIGAIGNHKEEEPHERDNNSSLVAMVTCAEKKYLTAGDIQKNSTMVGNGDENGEEIVLANSTVDLKADIMKLDHHGVRRKTSGHYQVSNEEKLIGKVKPMYSFIQTKGNGTKLHEKSESDKTKKYRQAYNSRMIASKHGFCYSLGDNEKNLIIEVTSGGITMSTSTSGKKEDREKLSGWVKLVGGNGYNKDELFDYYYIDTNGKPLKGIRKIGKKYYNMGSGGLMQRAHYKKGKKLNSGKGYSAIYKYWRKYTYEKKPEYRYYELPKKKKYRSPMKLGWAMIGDYCYYFLKSKDVTDKGRIGFRAHENKTKLGGKKYNFSKNGHLLSSWIVIGQYKYYVDKNGKKVKNKTISFKGSDKKYSFNGKGQLLKKKGGPVYKKPKKN